MKMLYKKTYIETILISPRHRLFFFELQSSFQFPQGIMRRMARDSSY